MGDSKGNNAKTQSEKIAVVVFLGPSTSIVPMLTLAKRILVYGTVGRLEEQGTKTRRKKKKVC